MVDCKRFLEEYSDFRDGLLPIEVYLDFEAHLEGCASCARYDRVVARGASLLRDLPGVEPSDDFLPRLQHRIHHLEDAVRGPGRSGSGLSASVALSVAALLALAAWAPVLRPGEATQRLPAVAARAPLQDPGFPQHLFVSASLLMHATLLHRDLATEASPRDDHLLFGYIPAGAPAVVRTAALD